MISRINNNNTTFEARIITALRPKDKSRLKNISEMFEHATRQYQKESLYLTRGKYSGVMSIHTSNVKVNDYIYQGEEIFTDTLDEHFATMTDKDIVKKMVSAFKVLRLSDNAAKIKENIKTNNDKYFNNLKIARRLRKVGRDNFAEKYEIFAKFNQEKHNKLNKELIIIKEQFNKQKEKSIKEFPEIGQVEI